MNDQLITPLMQQQPFSSRGKKVMTPEKKLEIAEADIRYIKLGLRRLLLHECRGPRPDGTSCPDCIVRRDDTRCYEHGPIVICGNDSD